MVSLSSANAFIWVPLAKSSGSWVQPCSITSNDIGRLPRPLSPGHLGVGGAGGQPGVGGGGIGGMGAHFAAGGGAPI